MVNERAFTFPFYDVFRSRKSQPWISTCSILPAAGSFVDWLNFHISMHLVTSRNANFILRACVPSCRQTCQKNDAININATRSRIRCCESFEVSLTVRSAKRFVVKFWQISCLIFRIKLLPDSDLLRFETLPSILENFKGYS